MGKQIERLRLQPSTGHTVPRLPGMRDLLPEPLDVARILFEEALTFLSEAGFRRVDTPLLEDSELFVRKGGGELAGLLYTFTEPGGERVSLRPEFTSSVIRLFIEGDRSDQPIRWSYAGPVFRYDRPGSRCRQFTQVGAEVIGASGVEVDAEVITTAMHGVNRLGVTDAVVKVGHTEALSRIFRAFDISDAARRFVTANLGRLKSGDTDAERLFTRAFEAGIVGNAPGAESDSELEKLRRNLIDGRNLGDTGRRTPKAILERLEWKRTQPRDPSELERALKFACELVYLEGDPDETIEAARSKVALAGAGPDALDPLEELLAKLNKCGIDRNSLVLDMGLARGIAYYTGAIFDLTSTTNDQLGGGGRYDGLVATLGGMNTPALGFAYDMEAIAVAVKN